MKQILSLLITISYFITPLSAQNSNLKVGEIVKDWYNGTIVHLKEDGSGLVYQIGNEGDMLTRNKVKLFPFTSLMKVGEALDIKFEGKDVRYLATYQEASKIYLLFIQNIKENSCLTRVELTNGYKEIGKTELLKIPNWKFDPRDFVVNWNTEKSALTISFHSEFIAYRKSFGVQEDWIKSHYVMLVNSNFTKASFTKINYEQEFNMPLVSSSYLIGNDYLVLLGSDQVRMFGMRVHYFPMSKAKKEAMLNVQDIAVSINLKTGKPSILKGQSLTEIGKAVNLMKILEENGKLTLIGSYSNSVLESHLGLFSATFDPAKSKISNIVKISWNDKLKGVTKTNQLDSFRLCDFFKTSSGGYYMPVEKINATEGSTGSSAAYCYNIVKRYVFVLNAKMELEKIIPFKGEVPFNFDFTTNHQYNFGSYMGTDFFLYNAFSSKGSTNEYTALHIIEINSSNYLTKVTEIGYKDSKNRIAQPPKQISLPIEKSGKVIFTGSNYTNFAVGSYIIQMP